MGRKKVEGQSTQKGQDGSLSEQGGTTRNGSSCIRVSGRTMEVDDKAANCILGKIVEAGNWVRRHVTPRRTLFTPMKVSRGPTSKDMVGRFRVSCMKNRNGVQCHIEEWKQSSNPHCTVNRYTGWTAFVNEIPDELIGLAQVELQPRGGNRNHTPSTTLPRVIANVASPSQHDWSKPTRTRDGKPFASERPLHLYNMYSSRTPFCTD